MIKQTIAAALVLGAASLAACGGAPEENVGSVEQAITCPAYLSCPYEPGYTFQFSVNTATSTISCSYKQTFGSQYISANLTKPAECPHCCASGYCPDERINQITGSGAWTCSA